MDDPGRERPLPTCPSCDHALAPRDGALECPDCGERVPVTDGVARFPVDVDGSALQGAFDHLAAVYETRVWFPVVYRAIAGSLSPDDDRATVAGHLDAAGGDVLDVACGTGRFTRHVAGEAAFAWGIDLSDGMLERARRYADRDGVGNVSFARMDAADLHFGDDAFDGVACCWALHLFPDVPAALSEVRRVLAPGGRFAGVTLTGGGPLGLPGARTAARRIPGVRTFDPGELRASLMDAGLATVEFERRGAALFFGAEG